MTFYKLMLTSTVLLGVSLCGPLDWGLSLFRPTLKVERVAAAAYTADQPTGLTVGNAAEILPMGYYTLPADPTNPSDGAASEPVNSDHGKVGHKPDYASELHGKNGGHGRPGHSALGDLDEESRNAVYQAYGYDRKRMDIHGHELGERDWFGRLTYELVSTDFRRSGLEGSGYVVDSTSILNPALPVTADWLDSQCRKLLGQAGYTTWVDGLHFRVGDCPSISVQALARLHAEVYGMPAAVATLQQGSDNAMWRTGFKVWTFAALVVVGLITFGMTIALFGKRDAKSDDTTTATA